MKSKNLIAVMAFISIMTFMQASGLYGQNVQETIGGEMTPDIAWRIEDNILYLNGKGVVPTTMLGARSPWHDYRSLFHSVVIEDGITGLGQNIFIGYKNITSLTVAGSVKDFAPNAFNSCKKLSVVEVKGAIPPDTNLAAFYKVDFKKAKLIVPAGTKTIYEADPLWNKFSTIEESAQPADTQPVSTPVETLEKPCTIHLTRTTNFVGGGVGVRVFLNGIEQEKLGNGQTIAMQTDHAKNELYIQQGKNRPVAIRRFDATAEGDIRIEFSYFLGYMKIMDKEKSSDL